MHACDLVPIVMGLRLAALRAAGVPLLSKIGIGFISNFLLKARKNWSLPLKVATDQFVICLVLLECLSVKICCISHLDSRANRDGADVEPPFPLFFSFSASFKNSNPREKVGKLSSFWDWWAESLFVSIIVAKYWIFFPALTMATRAKKYSGEEICSRYQRALSRFWARLRILNFIARVC